LVQQFISKEQKMIYSFHITAIEQTSFLSSLPLAESLSASDFRLADLKAKKITVFLVLPPKKLQKAGRWLRLILTAAVNELSATQKADKDVLLLVDEAKLLGNLPALQTVLSFSAGFGVKLWTFWQSMQSLNENYGDNGAAEFFDNSGLLQFFTPDNMEPAVAQIQVTGPICSGRIITIRKTSGKIAEPRKRKDSRL
jgi:type IV secretion system protein VirD4